jgi:hypothetical protein
METSFITPGKHPHRGTNANLFAILVAAGEIALCCSEQSAIVALRLEDFAQYFAYYALII